MFSLKTSSFVRHFLQILYGGFVKLIVVLKEIESLVKLSQQPRKKLCTARSVVTFSVFSQNKSFSNELVKFKCTL